MVSSSKSAPSSFCRKSTASSRVGQSWADKNTDVGKVCRVDLIQSSHYLPRFQTCRHPSEPQHQHRRPGSEERKKITKYFLRLSSTWSPVLSSNHSKAASKELKGQFSPPWTQSRIPAGISTWKCSSKAWPICSSVGHSSSLLRAGLATAEAARRLRMKNFMGVGDFSGGSLGTEWSNSDDCLIIFHLYRCRCPVPHHMWTFCSFMFSFTDNRTFCLLPTITIILRNVIESG